MAGVASAGTFVSAALQTAGFITQESILVFFDQHLRLIGFLLFIMTSVGAFISIALLGSYRFGIGLILGPCLFAFLIGSRSTTNGVVWKVGMSPPKDENGKSVSEEDAAAATMKAANPEYYKEYYQWRQAVNGRDKAGIEIALPFRIFTDVVDSAIKNINSLILPLKDDGSENVRNMLFVTKTYALDTLLGLEMNKGELFQMFQSDLIYKCRGMMDGGLALAGSELSQKSINDLKDERAALSPGNSQAADTYGGLIKGLEDKAEAENLKRIRGTMEPVTVNRATREFMVREQNATGDNATKKWMSEIHPGQRVEELSDINMTCGDLWPIVRDAIWRNARTLSTKVLNEYGEQLPDSEKGILCVELARKIGIDMPDSEKENCVEKSIVEITGVLMIRNALKSTGYSEVAQQVKDDMQLVAGVKRGRMVALVEDSQDWEIYNHDNPDDPYDTKIEYSENADGSKTRKANFRNKKTGKEQILNFAHLRSDLQGQLDGAFLRHQQFQTRELRQKFFAIVMQFPYYQGLCLYLLTIIYPFVALTVVIPGRSGAFVSYLLTWLWVKSWDVGFTMILVLDKVLWALFPSSDFSQDFFGGQRIGKQSLPEVLNTAFAIDPAYNVHAYYFILCTAILSVAPFTAMVTIKLRRSISQQIFDPLFENGIIGTAEDSGRRMADAFAGAAMNNQMSVEKELLGAAELVAGDRGAGLMSGMKGHAAEQYAAHKANSDVIAARLTHGDAQSLQMNAAQAELMRPIWQTEAKYDLLAADAMQSAAYNRVFHRELGQFGSLMELAESHHAYLDASGEWETYRTETAGLFRAMENSMITRMRMETQIMGTRKIAKDGSATTWKFINQINKSGSQGPIPLITLGETFQPQAWHEAYIQHYAVAYMGKNPLEDYYKRLVDSPEEREKVAQRINEEKERLQSINLTVGEDSEETKAIQGRIGEIRSQLSLKLKDAPSVDRERELGELLKQLEEENSQLAAHAPNVGRPYTDKEVEEILQVRLDDEAKNHHFMSTIPYDYPFRKLFGVVKEKDGGEK